ncbi:MAG: zinc ribbon domain-containing protein [Candidatus Promineofilum sp.]|nr:zinc ribbon domain-containing protein [Promineifilum sp.]MCW5864805.1 zinc ribbon domain-containing protein [Anaerolineae bacterium]
MIICPYCQASVRDTANFCGHCGHALREVAAATPSPLPSPHPWSLPIQEPVTEPAAPLIEPEEGSPKYPFTIHREGRMSPKVQITDADGTLVCVVQGATTATFTFGAGPQPVVWQAKGGLGKTRSIFDEAGNLIGKTKEVGYLIHKRHLLVMDAFDNLVADFAPHGARPPSARAVILGSPLASLMVRNAESMTVTVGDQEAFVITGKFPEFTMTALVDIEAPQQMQRLLLVGANLMTAMASQL